LQIKVSDAYGTVFDNYSLQFIACKWEGVILITVEMLIGLHFTV